MLVFITMLLMGMLLGLVGAGGAGVVIAVLTVLFGVPIHTALGTSLSAMAFTTMSGAVSHYREHNVIFHTGAAVGLFGAGGAFAGAKLATYIPAVHMHWLTGAMLFISAYFIYLKLFHPHDGLFAHISTQQLEHGGRFWCYAAGAGIVNGLLSGTFGIGATPFIQLTLLFFFGAELHEAVGTTMLIILPIGAMGGFGYMTSGLLDKDLFLAVVGGLMLGAYIGAKFTRRISPFVLKTAMIILPIIGGLMLLFGVRS